MIHNTRSRATAGWALAALLGLCLVPGCGREGQLPTYPVTGKVMFDGKPLAGAEIWLVPNSEEVKNAKITVRPTATSKADGTFTLTSYVTDDGAPLGDYTVIVHPSGPVGTAEEEEEVDPESPPPKKGRPKTFVDTVKAIQNTQFPSKYRSPATSGLTFTVKKENNHLELDLKSK